MMRSYQMLFCLITLSVVARGQSYYLFVGSYTNTGTLPGSPPLDSTGSKGIYVYRFDAATGKATLLSHTEGVCNPSYLTMAPGGHRLYSVTDSRMTGTGTVSAFDFDRAGGKLTRINKVASGGDNPAYIAIDPTGQRAAVANYTGGSFSIYAINADGALEPYLQNHVYSGHGVDPGRQEKPHVHSSVFSPDGQYLYIQDLGLDQISVLPFDPLSAKPATQVIHTVPGSGPRHLTFAPNGEYAYLIEEMGGCVDVYHYNKVTGRLDSVQRIAAHADTAHGPWRSSDIHLSPDGKYLYATNRAESSIAIFSVDKANGTLQTVGYQSVLGREPRNFTLDPTGNWLLVANQESKEIVIFKIDPKTGFLHPQGQRISVPSPSCLKMVP